MEQAVDAAEVDERAEVGDVLDDALTDLARSDLGEQLLFQRLPAILDQLATADDDVAALLVDLEDRAFDRAVDVIADVRRPADVDLARGQKDVDADVDEQAALDLAGDETRNDVPFLVAGDDVFPFLLTLRLAIAEDDGAGFVLDRFEQDLDRVADLRRRQRIGAVVLPLFERDDAFGLVADVDPHFVADDVEDAARDDLVGVEFGFLVGEPLSGLLGKGVVEFLREVFFVEIELAEKIAVDHGDGVPSGRPAVVDRCAKIAVQPRPRPDHPIGLRGTDNYRRIRRRRRVHATAHGVRRSCSLSARHRSPTRKQGRIRISTLLRRARNVRLYASGS